MLTAPKSEQTNRVLAPEGTHIARVVRLIQLGTEEFEWQGQKKSASKVWFDFELLEETHIFKEGEDPKPFVVGSKYTLSMAPKANLRKIVEGIIGASLNDAEADSFDIEQILGKACLANIKYNKKGDKTFVNIETTAPLMKGMVAKESFSPVVKLTFDNWNETLFTNLPKFLKEAIEKSPEYSKKGQVVINTPEVKAEDINYPNEPRTSSETAEGDSINIEDIPF